jgi:regulator of sirC expression with transglutaminase-like and TPR domain
MIGLTRFVLRASVLFAVALILGRITRADDPVPDAKINDPATAPILDAKPTDTSIQQLVAAAKKSVVVVSFTGRDGSRQGLGAGFIISSNGLIATNLHVIGEARPIQIELHDGRKFDVTSVQATERSQDLAILKIDAEDLPPLPLGNSDELQAGQPVIAIGNPLGLERSVVSGILSARREIDGRSMLQIALPIERGNSGGPLLDHQGRVHGLLTLKSLKTENLGFAIAVNALKPLMEKPNPIPMSRWLTIGAMDPDEWTILPGGRWRQRAGQISVEGRGGNFGGRALCLAKEATPEIPYEVAVQVKFTPAEGAAGLVFHADGGDRHYGFYPSNGGLRLSRFDGPDVFSWAVLRELHTPSLKKEGWNSLKVRVEEDRILCYLNGELVFESNDATYKAGHVGLCKFRQTEAEFKGFRTGKALVESRPSDDLLARATQAIAGETLNDHSINLAVERLAKEDATVIETLEQQAKALEARATQVRRIAADVHARQNLAEFQRVVQSATMDLLHGAMLLAKIDNPELDLNGYTQQVDRHAQRAKALVAAEATEQERLAALNRYLFEEQGFHGSRTDYGHRSNSYLNEVLDDREGLPITLSVLYIEIAKRMGLNVVGVGMPNHFLVRHEPKEGSSQLVDVFDRGRLLTNADARKIYEELSDRMWDDSYLNSIEPRAILERMLRNLLNSVIDSNDIERMLRYTEAILVLNPDSGIDHFNCGKICYFTQRWQQARSQVEWLTTHDSVVSRLEIEELLRAIDRESQK